MKFLPALPRHFRNPVEKSVRQMKTGFKTTIVALIILVLIILVYLGIRALIARKPTIGAAFAETFVPGDFALAGIEPAARYGQVLKVFGKPPRISRTSEPSTHNPDYVSYLETWIYPGLEIEFIANAEKGKPVPDAPGVVMRVLTTDHRYRTGRGVRVGDPLAKVTRKYGATEPDGAVYWYCGEAAYILFEVREGRVASIETGLTFD